MNTVGTGASSVINIRLTVLLATSWHRTCPQLRTAVRLGYWSITASGNGASTRSLRTRGAAGNRRWVLFTGRRRRSAGEFNIGQCRQLRTVIATSPSRSAPRDLQRPPLAVAGHDDHVADFKTANSGPTRLAIAAR